MGVFDLFGKEPRIKEEKRERFFEQPSVRETNQNAPVSVFFPSSYDEVASIIDVLKTGKNAIVHLDKLKTETTIQILNILSGAVYALGGGLYEIEKNVYMISPTGVEIK